MSAPDPGLHPDPLAGAWFQQRLENLDWAGGRSLLFSCQQSRLAGVSFSHRSIGEANVAATEFTACRLDRVQWLSLKMRAGQWQQCDCREMSAPRAWISGWGARESLFQNAGFQGACFYDCAFVNCELTGSSWKNAILLRVGFKAANFLGRPDLRRTDFSGALFMDADLAEADFSGADLQQTVFVRSNLSGAVLPEHALAQTRFLNCRGWHA